MAKKHDDEPERSVPRHTEAVEQSGGKAPHLSDKAQTPTPEEVDRAVEYMSQAFAAAVPEEALREGQYELPADDALRRMKNDKIPDGSYRVAGHEWILDFAGGHLVGVTRATEDSSPSSYTSVPQPRS